MKSKSRISLAAAAAMIAVPLYGVAQDNMK